MSGGTITRPLRHQPDINAWNLQLEMSQRPYRYERYALQLSYAGKTLVLGYLLLASPVTYATAFKLPGTIELGAER